MPDLHCLHHAAFIYLVYDDINDNLKVRGLAECSMKQQTGAQRIMGYGGVAKKKYVGCVCQIWTKESCISSVVDSSELMHFIDS